MKELKGPSIFCIGFKFIKLFSLICYCSHTCIMFLIQVKRVRERARQKFTLDS